MTIALFDGLDELDVLFEVVVVLVGIVIGTVPFSSW